MDFIGICFVQQSFPRRFLTRPSGDTKMKKHFLPSIDKLDSGACNLSVWLIIPSKF